MRDPDYELPAADTFAQQLKNRFQSVIPSRRQESESISETLSTIDVIEGTNSELGTEPVDIYESYTVSAIAAVKNNVILMSKIRNNGIPWYGFQVELMNALPNVIDESERRSMAYSIVPRAMNEIFGDGNWETEKRDKVTGSGTTTWLVIRG